jgi:hypothetical protein
LGYARDEITGEKKQTRVKKKGEIKGDKKTK